MPDQIRDGAGRGYLAKVDSTNHLYVAANTKSRMAMQSEVASKAYSIYGKLNHVAGTGTDEGILFFQYDGSDYFFVDQIVFASAGLATGSDLAEFKFELYRNATYGSGGTAGTPVNTDFSSSLTLSSTVYTGASALTVTKGSSEIIDVRVGNGTTTVHFDGALILGKSNNLYILGEALAATDEMRVMVLGYEGTKE